MAKKHTLRSVTAENKPKLKPEEMTSFLQELMDGERIVNVNDRLVVLRLPRLAVINATKRVYDGVLAIALKGGAPSRVVARTQLAAEMKKINIDYSEYQKKIEDIQLKLMDHMEETMDESQAENIYETIEDLLRAVDKNLDFLAPDELNYLQISADISTMENSIMGSCAEAQAEAQANLFMMTEQCYDINGKKLWSSLDDIEQETDIHFVQRLSEEFQRFRSGYPLLYEVIKTEALVEQIPNAQASS